MEQVTEGTPTISGTSIPKPGVCWLTAPGERSPGFLPVFARVSLAVQSALRQHVPAAYFAALENFQNTKTAYPMLIYQASRPFRGKIRTDLTYDVLNPKSLAALFRAVKPVLPELLDQVAARLRAAGLDELAAQYASRHAARITQSVRRLSRSRKCLYFLIRAESVLVNALVELGGLGGFTPREQARKIASFEKKWTFQLRRLYPGTDFVWLAPALLHAASQALLAEPEPASKPDSSASANLPDSVEPGATR